MNPEYCCCSSCTSSFPSCHAMFVLGPSYIAALFMSYTHIVPWVLPCRLFIPLVQHRAGNDRNLAHNDDVLLLPNSCHIYVLGHANTTNTALRLLNKSLAKEALIDILLATG